MAYQTQSNHNHTDSNGDQPKLSRGNHPRQRIIQRDKHNPPPIFGEENQTSYLYSSYNVQHFHYALASSRVLTCIAPHCQESPLLVIYQSRQSHAKNLLFGRRSDSAPPLLIRNTVPIHGTYPFGCADALSRQWPGVPPAYSRAPPGIQISPKRAKSLSLKSQLFGAMLYPSGPKKLTPIIYTFALQPVKSYSPTHIRIYSTTNTVCSNNRQRPQSSSN
jgi:hypothetical protein